MKGRGVRVISEPTWKASPPAPSPRTTSSSSMPSASASRTRPTPARWRKSALVTFDKLLQAVALGNPEPEVLESLAGRLVRFEKRFDDALEAEVRATAKGQTLREIAQTVLAARIPTTSKPKPRKAKTKTFNRPRKTCSPRKPSSCRKPSHRSRPIPLSASS